MSVNLSGTVIKKSLILVLVLTLFVPVAHSAPISIAAKAKATPSPSPTWPPAKSFVKSKDGNTFIKIPSAKELVGLASGNRALTRSLAATIDGIPVCEKFSCGAVQVASLIGCTWWIVTANVRGTVSTEDLTKKIFGSVRTTFKATGAKKYATILIVSQEPIELNHSIGSIKAVCRQDTPQERVPTTAYTVNP